MRKAGIDFTRTARFLARVLSVLAMAWGAGFAAADERAATRTARLEVGSAAPPLRADRWLNGREVDVAQRSGPQVYVVVFWASWSGPSRVALPEMARLHEEYRKEGVVLLAVTEEDAEDVRAFVRQDDPEVPFRVAVDADGSSREAYCGAAGVAFVPYAFVIGPERRIAWHGHPQEPALERVVDALLGGTYDMDEAAQMVNRARTVDQLEALFREACANGRWQTALMALDGLLEADVPSQRLLRYKLSILLGEMGDVAGARALAERLMKAHADDAAFLNSVAWDLLSEPRRYREDPALALRVAQAAYEAGRGELPAAADTYARALHMVGRLEEAIEVQREAVAATEGAQRIEHQKMLKFYERCRALGAGLESDSE